MYPGATTGTFTTTPAIIDTSHYGADISVSCVPASGNTDNVYFSITPQAAQSPSTANWYLWSYGAVTTPQLGIIPGRVTAVKFIQTAGNAGADTYEVF